jgi:hypothetical protein
MRITWLCGVLAVLSIVPVCRAAGVAGGFSREPIGVASLRDRVEIGASYEQKSRDVRLDHTQELTLKTRHVSSYLSVDVFTPLAVFASVGRSELRIDDEKRYEDDESEYAYGLKLTMLALELDKTTFDDARFLLATTAQRQENRSNLDDHRIEWTENRASLLGGVEWRAQRLAAHSDDVRRQSTILFAGPTYSTIDGKLRSGASGDVSAANDLSWITGIECRWRQQLTLGAHVYFFNDPSFTVSMGYHF